jgi:formate hydrogenlyase transcriptional activator
VRAPRAFRADLYYRLNVFPISVPPLREREGDIPLLAGVLLDAVAKRLRREFEPLSPEVLKLLQGYDWPGNVRELQNVIERAALSAPGRVVDIPPEWVGRRSVEGPVVGDSAEPVTGLGGVDGDQEANAFGRLARQRVELRKLERLYISEVLAQTRWRIDGPKGAASLLGLPASTLRSRMRKLGIK